MSSANPPRCSLEKIRRRLNAQQYFIHAIGLDVPETFEREKLLTLQKQNGCVWTQTIQRAIIFQMNGNKNLEAGSLFAVACHVTGKGHH